MAPDDVFLLLINRSSKNKPVQKLIAKYVFDCYEERRLLVIKLTLIIVSLVCNVCYDFKLFG